MPYSFMLSMLNKKEEKSLIQYFSQDSGIHNSINGRGYTRQSGGLKLYKSGKKEVTEW